MLLAYRFDQGSCYTNRRNRLQAIQAMLSSACRIFVDTSLINKLDFLIEAFKPENKELLVQGEYWDLIYSLDFPVLDATRICICFENYFKSELLRKGYVIHKIDKHHLPPKDEYLYKLQLREPIKISTIKDIAGVKGKKDHGYIFECLYPSTIEFKYFLREKIYRAAVDIPEDVFPILERINSKRNKMHYLIGDGHQYSSRIVDDLKKVKQYYNRYVVKRHNMAAKSLKLSDKFLFAAI